MDTITASFRNAILSGDLEDVKRCLANGCSPNTLLDNELPLTFAIRNGEEEVAVYLISHGANLRLAPLHVPQKAPEDSTGPPQYSAKTLSLRVASSLTLGLAIQTLSEIAWGWLLQSGYWPPFIRPLLRRLHSQSTVGFWMRLSLQDACRAVYQRRLRSWLPSFARYIPSYFVMYLIGSRISNATPQPLQLQSFPNLPATFFQQCFKVVFWNLKGIGFFFGQELFYMAGQQYFKGKGQDVLPQDGGSSAIRAICKHKGGSDAVAYALLKARAVSKTDLSRVSIPQADYELKDMLSLWTWALSEGHDRIVQEFLDLGFSVSQPAVGQWRGLTGIEMAAYHGHQNIVEMLIPLMSQEDLLPMQQLSAAMVISAKQFDTWRISEDLKTKHASICKLLLSHTNDIDFKDREGTTCLIAAVQGDNVALVELLLDRGAKVNLADGQGRPPLLHLRHRSNWNSILKMLLNAGAEINHVSNDGDTILLIHARLSNTKVVEALLEAGANPKIVDSKGSSAMHHAARYTMTDMMQSLLAAGAEIDGTNAYGNTPLLEACGCHRLRAPALRLLLENGARANVFDDEGMTPLIRVCDDPSYGLDSSDYEDTARSIEVLLEYGADVNAHHSDVRYYRAISAQPLGIIAENSDSKGMPSALRALLEAGASPNSLGRHGKPALASICSEGSRVDDKEDYTTICFELLLQYGADIYFRDDDLRSLVHLAADSANFRALTQLLNADWPSKDPDFFGRTPLHLACRDSRWMLMDTFNRWSAAGGYNGLEYANWHCSMESSLTLVGLLAHGASAYDEDMFGCTAAHIAAKAGNPRVMAMLLVQGGTALVYDCSDHQDRLPFHHAVHSPEVTRLLLHYHSTHEILADRYWQVMEPPRNTMSYLKHELTQKAIEMSQQHRYEECHAHESIDEATYPRPWRRGLVNAKDKHGNTPLHYAALGGNAEVVQLYLDMPDIDPTVCNKDGETPLDFALNNRDCGLAIVAKLTQLGITVPNERGDGGTENLKSESRIEADTFVKALSEYGYSAYPVERGEAGGT